MGVRGMDVLRYGCGQGYGCAKIWVWSGYGDVLRYGCGKGYGDVLRYRCGQGYGCAKIWV